MKGIKKVFELYRLDWRRIFHNKLTFILIICLMVIPSLYAWFNIGALWDPYSNTGGIKIAVYSADKTATIMDQKVNIGETIMENLKENDTLGWQFVDSKEELDKGVKSGKYYAGIYLPKNFSENLLSFTDGDFKNPEIEYSVNQKINAIAPKVSDKGASTIKDTISEEFVEAVSKTLVEVLNEVGFNLDSNLPSIKKMSKLVLEVNDHLDEIDGYTKKVVALNDKMPELKEKLKAANEFVDLIPELNQMTKKVTKINGKMPEIEQYGSIIYEVQGKIPNIQNAGKQINQVDNDFNQIVSMMDDAIKEAKNGLGIIKDAQKVLPDVGNLITNVDEMIPKIQTDLDKVSESLPNIASSVDSSLKIIQLISSETIDVTNSLLKKIDDNQLSTENLESIKQELINLSERLDNQSQMIGQVISLLQDLQNVAGTEDLSGIIAEFEKTQVVVDGLKQHVDEAIAHFDEISSTPEKLKETLQAINSEATHVNTVVSSIDISAILKEVNAVIASAQTILADAGKFTGEIIDNQLIARVDKLMTSTSQTIQQAISFLESYQKELPAIQEEIHSANTLLNGNMNLIINGINDGADFYTNDFPTLKNKLNTADSFIQNELPDIEEDIQGTMKTVNEKEPDFEKALTTATDLIKNDWPDIKKSITRASDLIKKGETDFDLDEIIKYLKSDANKESNFISNPVNLKQKDVYPVPNYGSASTPFYTALCLWVGAVLFSSIATTKIALTKRQKKKYTKRQLFLARMLTFLTVGFFQALIVTIGNQWLLGAYTKNPIWNLIFTLFIGFVFMSMVYVLVALFDNLGKGIAIVILVLSISAGGGNFPIEMSGPFFRAIHPFIPFTHAVNLLRESVGGIYWPTAIKAIVILAFVSIVFLIIGYLLYPKSERLFSKVKENMDKGKILH